MPTEQMTIAYYRALFQRRRFTSRGRRLTDGGYQISGWRLAAQRVLLLDPSRGIGPFRLSRGSPQSRAQSYPILMTIEGEDEPLQTAFVRSCVRVKFSRLISPSRRLRQKIRETRRTK